MTWLIYCVNCIEAVLWAQCIASTELLGDCLYILNGKWNREYSFDLGSKLGLEGKSWTAHLGFRKLREAMADLARASWSQIVLYFFPERLTKTNKRSKRWKIVGTFITYIHVPMKKFPFYSSEKEIITGKLFLLSDFFPHSNSHWVEMASLWTLTRSCIVQLSSQNSLSSNIHNRHTLPTRFSFDDWKPAG